MTWERATEYRGIIGGCHFANVPTVVEYAGQPFVTIKRNLEDRQVGIDADIVDQNGGVVAEVRNGRITLRDEEHYHARVLKGRSAIINKTTGFIPFDFEAYSEQSHVDLELSLLTHLPNGLPIALHPNRIRIGSPRILKPHLSFLKLETKYGAPGPGIRINLAATDNSPTVMHDPRVPMVGSNSVVRSFVSWGEESDQSDTSKLFMYNSDDNMAASIQFEGPCYFLDLSFSNFQTAISVEVSAGAEKA